MYMLDTNIVSQIVRAHPRVLHRVRQTPMHRLCISAITGGELMFGLARKPDAVTLHTVIAEFLHRVDVWPWDSAVMQRYGRLRALLQQAGTTLGPLDMLIAAHALQTQCVLVTNDAAFARIDGLAVEDWTR